MPIHPQWPNMTCLIAQRRDNEVKHTYSLAEVTIRGSGIIQYYENNIILVTARHIVENRNKLVYCLNIEDPSSRNSARSFYDIETMHEQNNWNWHFHPNSSVDIAVTRAIKPESLKCSGKDSWIRFSKISPSSTVFFLGYPLGLVFADDLTPIIKKASIARVIRKETHRDLITFPEKTILIDGYIDQGNSGSPIIQEKELFMHEYKKWTKRDANQEGIIGIAVSHFVSGRNNIGLGVCHSIDYLLEILESEAMISEFG